MLSKTSSLFSSKSVPKSVVDTVTTLRHNVFLQIRKNSSSSFATSGTKATSHIYRSGFSSIGVTRIPLSTSYSSSCHLYNNRQLHTSSPSFFPRNGNGNGNENGNNDNGSKRKKLKENNTKPESEVENPENSKVTTPSNTSRGRAMLEGETRSGAVLDCYRLDPRDLMF